MESAFYQTRIGKIIQAEIIPSITGARDIGGALATRTGRIVIAAGISDGGLNYPYKIVITDDGGKTTRDVFTMPASAKVTYHTLGLAYDHEKDVLISMFSRNNGYVLLDGPYGKTLPFSLDRVGDNEAIVAISSDDGETWQIEHREQLPKPQNSHGMFGAAVQVGQELFFPHGMGTSNDRQDQWRMAVNLASLRLIPKPQGGYTCDYTGAFRTIATNSDQDIPFSCETIYIEKADYLGYLAFVRNPLGPPYRREYDLNHHPLCEFERCRILGFDQRDYDLGHNGPILVAFGIIRMADGNLLYSGRFYGTDHHRAGDIFMTSTDEGKTWLFDEDYIARSITPLEFYTAGAGGNPQMSYEPDGTMTHITSQGLMGGNKLDKDGRVSLTPPPKGGFCLCRFKGLNITQEYKDNNKTQGTITIDASTITRVQDVHIAKISIIDSGNIETENPDENLFKYSADRTQINIEYEKVADPAFIQLKVVLSNESNPHRPTFTPRINID